jgi:hypothetical protein
VTCRPQYKILILTQTQIDQLESYLGVAKNNLADHASGDCEDLKEEIENQIDKQRFQHKTKLLTVLKHS